MKPQLKWEAPWWNQVLDEWLETLQKSDEEHEREEESPETPRVVPIEPAPDTEPDEAESDEDWLEENGDFSLEQQLELALGDVDEEL